MVGNRIRIFSELVSIDAWYPQFTSSRSRVSLHADVTFHTARLGGEPGSPVTFTLDLKRAELRVIIPETEHIAIDRSSVARFDDGATAIRKTRSKSRTSGGIGSVFGLGATSKGASAALKLQARASKDYNRTEEVVTTEKLKKIIVSHSVDAERNNRWHFSPALTSTLNGKPWASRDQKLMKLVDKRQTIDPRFEPVVRLELSCLREDLDVDAIELVDGATFAAAMAKLGGDRRLRAAEAFIRNRIQEEGLPTPRMENDHAQIILADLMAVQD
ncbi:hypothetical protein [Rhizobium leguminosarum]|uniref:hypothetical protein n=1 Tax=Rhizobium leguminosarum TaxID=384 RepID=UPI0024B3A2A2|nr:hypothetical protein [Rhizobium leguminosarum]WHO84160.1 hypothetical protein QMO81_007108 [Rhizobium leguminosarum]